MEGGLWDTGMCILQYRGVSLLSRVQKNSSCKKELFWINLKYFLFLLFYFLFESSGQIERNRSFDEQ